MRQILAILAFMPCAGNAQLTFSISSANGFTITCATGNTLTLKAASNYTTPVNYIWSGPGGFSHNGDSAHVVSAGSYTVAASSGSLNSSQVVFVASNTVVPVASSGPTFVATNTAAPTVFTFAVISPTINYVWEVYPPMGGVHVGNTPIIHYIAGVPGTYTYCIIDMVNLCSSCGTLVVGTMPSGPGQSTLSAVEHSGATKQVLFVNGQQGGIEFFSTEEANAMIYSLTGSLIRRQPVVPDQKYNLSLPAGVYLVRESSGKQRCLRVLVW